MNNSEAGLSCIRLGRFSCMATTTQCDKHLFEEAAGMCRVCRRPFCPDCLVYAQGPNKAPFCIPCALTAAGVRSTAASQARRGRRGLAGRLLGGVAATAAAVVIAVPALSQIH
jgi:hypothetical protein